MGGCTARSQASNIVPQGTSIIWVVNNTQSKCKSVAVASMYRNSSGVTYRTTFRRMSGPDGYWGGTAPAIPAGTTYLGQVSEICPKSSSTCTQFTITP